MVGYCVPDLVFLQREIGKGVGPGVGGVGM